VNDTIGGRFSRPQTPDGTFAGSAEGAHRVAIIYSIVATCRQHGLDPAALSPAAWKGEQLD